MDQQDAFDILYQFCKEVAKGKNESQPELLIEEANKILQEIELD